jgi:hypothetical protein
VTTHFELKARRATCPKMSMPAPKQVPFNERLGQILIASRVHAALYWLSVIIPG